MVPLALLPVLLLLGSADIAMADTCRVIGQSTPSSYSCCQADISSVELECPSPTQAIHIIQLKLGDVSSCTASTESDCQLNATLYDDPVSLCEGRKGSCSMEMAKWSGCTQYNSVNITFQCVPESAVLPICPNQKQERVTTNKAEAMFLATTDFFLPNLQLGYRSDTKCICEITPSPGSLVHLQPLYIDLEIGSGNCDTDRIAVSPQGSEYCGIEGLLSNPPLPVLSLTQRSTLEFTSDESQEQRGAWFKLYPDADSTFNLSCVSSSFRTTEAVPQRSEAVSQNSSLPTTRRQPTTRRRSTSVVTPSSTPYTVTDDDDDGTRRNLPASGSEPPPSTKVIVGATVGVAVLLIAVVAGILYWVHTRPSESQRYAVGQQQSGSGATERPSPAENGGSGDSNHHYGRGGGYTNSTHMYGLPATDEDCYTVTSLADETSLNSNLYRTLVSEPAPHPSKPRQWV